MLANALGPASVIATLTYEMISRATTIQGYHRLSQQR